MQEQSELVGCRLGARCSVGGQMRLPGLDVVLGRATPAVEVRVERLGPAAGEIGEDEASGAGGAITGTGEAAAETAPQGGEELR